MGYILGFVKPIVSFGTVKTTRITDKLNSYECGYQMLLLGSNLEYAISGEIARNNLEFLIVALFLEKLHGRWLQLGIAISRDIARNNLELHINRRPFTFVNSKHYFILVFRYTECLDIELVYYKDLQIFSHRDMYAQLVFLEGDIRFEDSREDDIRFEDSRHPIPNWPF